MTPSLGVALAAAMVVATLVVLADARLRRMRARARALSAVSPAPAPRRGGGWLAAVGSRSLPETEGERAALRSRLERAGYRDGIASASFVGARLVAAAAGAACGLVAVATAGSPASTTWLLAFVPAAVGYMLPPLALGLLERRRQAQIARELPDVLDMLLIGMDAGLGVESALDRVSRELAGVAPLLGEELEQYGFEVRAGVARAAALQRLGDRLAHPAVTAVVQVLLQSARHGTDLVASLRAHAAALREERRQGARERGARRPVQLTFPMILFILPALMLVVMGPALIRLLERLGDGA